MSGTAKIGSHRFSRDGFVPLTSTQSRNNDSRGDVTVDIPLAPVATNTQTKQANAASANPYSNHPTFKDAENNEKSGLFHRGHAGRRIKKINSKGEVTGSKQSDDDEDTLTQMGKLYNKILNFSIVTRYIVYVLPLAGLIAIPIVIGATAAKQARLGGVRIVWIFTWVEMIWLSLWVSKLFALSLPWIFQFLCGIVSSGTRKYALVLKALNVPLTLVGWALASLCTFIPLMTRNPDQRASGRRDPKALEIQRWQRTINQILAATLVATLLFLGERLLIHLLSINYHRKQFDARIKDSKRNVHLLSLLYDASRTLFPAYCDEFVEEDYIISDSIAAGTTSRENNRRSGAATPMRLIQNVGRYGDKLTAAFGNIASEITGKQVFNPTSAHSVVVEALEKRKSSEALARRLWMSFVVEGKDALYQEDIVEVLGSDREAEAMEAFSAIDKDGNGDISLDEMIMAIVAFGRERHSIATSMADVGQAINKLDSLLCTILFIIVVFVFVAFLNASFTTTLATAGTALLSLSFVFAVTAQEVLGSCIFLFVKHPYDVGDRVDINNSQLTVEHISLLFSIFKRVDNHKVVQIPHIVLNSLWIENISRSKAMREQINIFINFDTSLEDINALKNEIQAFVLNKENNRDFLPDVEVEVVGLAEMNKLELKVEVKHKSNWSNETLRAGRRSKFMCALVLALRRIPIYGPGCGDALLGDLGKPTYSVAITDAEAAANREAFAATKEAKRLFPSKTEPKKEDSDTGKSSGNDYFGKKDGSGAQPDSKAPSVGVSERTAVDALNDRDPADDSARDEWEADREEARTPGGRTVAEARRSNEIEEVRGLLHRDSTRGRRKAAGVPAQPAVPAITEVQTPPAAASAEQPQWPRRKQSLSERRALDVHPTVTVPAPTVVNPQYQPWSSPQGSVPMGNASPYQQPQQQQQSSPSRATPRVQSPFQDAQQLPQQQPPPQRPLPRDPAR